MRRLLVAIALMAAVMGGCKDVGGPAAPDLAPPTSGESHRRDSGSGTAVPRAVTVEIESFEFRGPADRARSPVAVGDTLVFVNRDAAPHTATSTSVPSGAVAFDTGRLNQGESARVVVTAPGTYAFRCDFHPAMTGTVAASAAPGNGGNPPPSGTPPPGGNPPGGTPPPGGNPPPAGNPPPRHPASGHRHGRRRHPGGPIRGTQRIVRDHDSARPVDPLRQPGRLRSQRRRRPARSS